MAKYGGNIGPTATPARRLPVSSVSPSGAVSQSGLPAANPTNVVNRLSAATNEKNTPAPNHTPTANRCSTRASIRNLGESAKRFSAPRARRAKFDRCRSATSAAATRLNPVNIRSSGANGAGVRATRTTASATAAATDATDMYRVTARSVAQVRAAAAAGPGRSTATTPNPVATPLPPRNRSQTGNRWPRNAASPAATPAGVPKAAAITAVGTVPLRKSRAKTTTP